MTEAIGALRRLFLYGTTQNLWGVSSLLDNFMLHRATSIYATCTARDEHVDAVVDVLPRTLKTTNMHYCCPMLSRIALARIVQRCPRIIQLNHCLWAGQMCAQRDTYTVLGDHLYFKTHTTDFDVHSAMISEPYIKHVTLDNCSCVTEVGIACIAQAYGSQLRCFSANRCNNLNGNGISFLFSRCANLKLKECAFRQCVGITNVTLGALTVIPDGTFAYCVNLRQVRTNPLLMKIGEAAFWGCEELKDFDVDASRVDIEPWAFAGCGKLYPQNVKWIGIFRH